MRRSVRFLVGTAVVLPLLLTSCLSIMAFWPNVDPPVGDGSMLIVEAGVHNGSETQALWNTNVSGWAPWVVDDRGNEIPFKPFDTESRVDSFYYSENLSPGTYTLKGFMHVYVDYSILPEDIIPTYGPFSNYAYDLRQYFPLDREVTISLGSRSIETFGRYFVESKYVGGASGTTDDRWKMVESSVRISGDRNDRKAMRVAKNWATLNWTLWNAYNPETAADE